MPREYNRSSRVAELVRRELAVIIREYTRNKIHSMITITSVDISPDLKNAKIYITSLDDNKDKNEIVDLLNAQAGQFRHDLAQSVFLRTTPKLNFILDTTLERANKLSSLIDSLSHHKSV